MSGKRIGAVLAGAAFAIWAFVAASSVSSQFEEDEARASSAPQQQVVAGWAVKDAAINGLRLLGVLGGLVIVSLSVLTSEAEGDEEREEKLVRERKRKRCRFCAELVRVEATACRHCGRDIAPPEPVYDGPPGDDPEEPR